MIFIPYFHYLKHKLCKALLCFGYCFPSLKRPFSENFWVYDTFPCCWAAFNIHVKDESYMSLGEILLTAGRQAIKMHSMVATANTMVRIVWHARCRTNRLNIFHIFHTVASEKAIDFCVTLADISGVPATAQSALVRDIYCVKRRTKRTNGLCRSTRARILLPFLSKPYNLKI